MNINPTIFLNDREGATVQLLLLGGTSTSVYSVDNGASWLPLALGGSSSGGATGDYIFTGGLKSSGSVVQIDTNNIINVINNSPSTITTKISSRLLDIPEFASSGDKGITVADGVITPDASTANVAGAFVVVGDDGQIPSELLPVVTDPVYFGLGISVADNTVTAISPNIAGNLVVVPDDGKLPVDLINLVPGYGVTISGSTVSVDKNTVVTLNTQGKIDPTLIDFPEVPEYPEQLVYTAGNHIQISADRAISVVTGTTAGCIPILNSNAKLDAGLLPVSGVAGGVLISESGNLYISPGIGLDVNDNGDIDLQLGDSLGLDDTGNLVVVGGTDPGSVVVVGANGKIDSSLLPIIDSDVDVIQYTAGNGIDISSDNKISVKGGTAAGSVVVLDNNGKVPETLLPVSGATVTEYVEGNHIQISAGTVSVVTGESAGAIPTLSSDAKLDVALLPYTFSDGLDVSMDGKTVSVAAGSGITVDGDKLAIDTGSGLDIDLATGKVVVAPGSGLGIDAEGRLFVTGSGGTPSSIQLVAGYGIQIINGNTVAASVFEDLR